MRVCALEDSEPNMANPVNVRMASCYASISVGQ